MRHSIVDDKQAFENMIWGSEKRSELEIEVSDLPLRIVIKAM